MGAELEKVIAAFTASADAVGALVLDAEPGLVKPFVVLEVGDLQKLVDHARPSIIYLSTQIFDVDDKIADVFGSADQACSDSLTPECRDFRRKSLNRNGHIYQVAISIFVSGVQHFALQTTDWYDALDEELEAMAGSRMAIHEMEVVANEAALDSKFRHIADELAGHAAFSSGRPSADKRRALARALFPDLDPTAVYRITEIADEIFWLRSNGVQSPNQK